MTEFDEQLRERLRAFQRAQGLSGDAVAGEKTWQLLVVGGQGSALLAKSDRGRASGSQAPGAEAGPAPGGPETPELTRRLDEIQREYRAIVADGRGRGWDVAADNLQRFLDGTGGTRTLSVGWLRGFGAVTDAERVNEGRFEDSLNDLANQMRHGDRRTFTDHWSRMLTGAQTSELYYASGTSTIRSTGTFELSVIEHTVSISGTVTHHWYDPYDWHAGLGAFVPGHGNVSDADALLMQQYRGARPYDMEADWTRRISGHIEVGTVYNDRSLSWSGP